MPELPEVETIVKELKRKVKGKKIKQIEVLASKMLKGEPRSVLGLKIQGARRRAKLIIFDLEKDKHLIVHLKLTGQLIYKMSKLKAQMSNEKDLGPTRLTINFTDGTRLDFNDLRKFGWLKIVDKRGLEELLDKENYGPEPLEKEFTVEKFKALVSGKKNSQIKALLMDQTFIAGIGNIYSDEILFYVGVHPKRKAGDLTKKEVEKIYQGIGKVLREALKYKGTSTDTYRTTEGKKGLFEFHRKVYRRDGEKCLRCGSAIKAIKMGGRTTRFCPKCQK